MQKASHEHWGNRLSQIHQNLILTGVILMVYAVHALSPVTTSTDSAWTFHLAASILREGNINLDEYRNIIDLQLDYRLRVVEGHIYSYYPVATPLLVTPLVWLINEVYPLRYRMDFYTYLAQHGPDARLARLESLIAAGIVAAAAALIYLIARRELGVLHSLAITFIFAFATSMWSTASRALWQHGPSVLFLTFALYLALLAKEKEVVVPWIGLVLGFAYLIRPTNSLSAALFGLYVWFNHRKRILQYVAGVALVLVPYIILNWLTYRNIFPPYSYQLFERFASLSVFGEALAGTLISPARGLFIFSPIFLFFIYGAYRRTKQKQMSLLSMDSYLLGIILTHWIITSLFEDWGGAWSIGPRYFVDVIPFLMYFLIPVLKDNLLAAPGPRIAFLITILASFLIQFHCATSIYPFLWNGKPKALVEAPERKWDWGDLQFLRGLCKGDPLEGRAPACWLETHG